MITSSKNLKSSLTECAPNHEIYGRSSMNNLPGDNCAANKICFNGTPTFAESVHLPARDKLILP